MATHQFDNYQLNPQDIGSTWVFEGDQIHSNRSSSSVISNYNMYFVGARMTYDRTKTTFGSPDPRINPPRVINDGFLGHGVDWSLFNYNPYGKDGVGTQQNPNFRVLNDWLQITGLGDLDVVTDDVMDKDEVSADGMLQYRNYPSEGYNSFGKKSGGASGDTRWIWQGNTWVPGGTHTNPFA
jgi:hypothetical protein